MKRLLTLLLTLATMASCLHDVQQDVGGAGIPTEGLNETGLQFVKMLQKRPTWQTEWTEMTEHGSPLPNEMIMIGSIGSEMTYCFVPVVRGKKIVRMVVAPIIHTTKVKMLGLPKILDEEGIDNDSVARSFVELDLVGMWHDKGLTLDVQLTPQEPVPQTRSGNAQVFMFQVLYYIYDYKENTDAEINTKGTSIVLGFLPRQSDGVEWHAAYPLEKYTFGVNIESTYLQNGEKYFHQYSSQLITALRTIMSSKWHIIADFRVRRVGISGGGNLTGSGNSSSGTPNGGSNIAPFPGATYFRSHLPPTITAQEEGKEFCAIAIMSFLFEHFGKEKQTQKDIARDLYVKSYTAHGKLGPAISYQGIRTDVLVAYLNSEFNTVDFASGSSFSSADLIAHKSFVMLDVAAGFNTHTILLIGAEGGDFVYYDPSDGLQKKMAAGSIKPVSYMIEIKGAK